MYYSTIQSSVMNILPPPATQDFGFYNRYVFKTPNTDLIHALQDNWKELQKMYLTASDEMISFRYDTGKWSMKEILQHLIDGERNFCYRAMRISRKDQTPIPVYNMDSFVTNAHLETKELTVLLKEMELARMVTINMFQSMHPDMLEETGPARDAIVSVRAIGFAIVGHTIHHMDVIRERYLTAFSTYNT
jgi:DinB superfamily